MLNRNYFLNSNVLFRRIKNVVKFAPLTYQIWRSNAFKGDLYTIENPDVLGSTFFKMWHFGRYHQSHERASGQDIIHDWLLNQIVRNRVKGSCVKEILEDIKDKSIISSLSVLEAFCKKHGLSFEVLSGYLAHSFNNRPAMQAALQHVIEARFIEDGVLLQYDLSKLNGLSDNIFDVLHEALKDLERGQFSRTLKYYRAVLQMSEAVGVKTTRNNKSIFTVILEHIERTQYEPIQTMREDLWTLGAYFGDVSDIDSDILQSVLPVRVSHQLKESPQIQSTNIRGWEPFLKAATYNMLGVPPTFLECDSRDNWRYSNTKNIKKVVTVRVMPSQYWVDADANLEFSDHLNAFKHLCGKLIKQGKLLYPIAAGQIYDMSRAKPDYRPILSYHTYASPALSNDDIHFKETALKGYYSEDSCGFSGWACPNLSQSVDLNEALKFYDALFEKFVSRNLSKYEQPKSKDLPFMKDFLFVPLQVPGDVVNQLSRIDVFEALEHLLNNKKEIWQKIALDAVIIKVHPKDKSAVTKKRLAVLLEKFPDDIIISENSIHDLLSQAKVVMTVNSGVGAEALLHLKPVVTLGAAYYSSLTQSVNTLSELIPTLCHAVQRSKDVSYQEAIKIGLYKLYFQNSFTLP